MSWADTRHHVGSRSGEQPAEAGTTGPVCWPHGAQRQQGLRGRRQPVPLPHSTKHTRLCHPSDAQDPPGYAFPASVSAAPTPKRHVTTEKSIGRRNLLRVGEPLSCSLPVSLEIKPADPVIALYGRHSFRRIDCVQLLSLRCMPAAQGRC